MQPEPTRKLLQSALILLHLVFAMEAARTHEVTSPVPLHAKSLYYGVTRHPGASGVFYRIAVRRGGAQLCRFLHTRFEGETSPL